MRASSSSSSRSASPPAIRGHSRRASRSCAPAPRRSSSSRRRLAVYGGDRAIIDEAGMKKWGKPEFAPILRAFVARLDAVEPFSHAGIEEAARALAAQNGLPLGQIAQPARLALTGSLASPPLFEMIEVLGRETARRRILAFADRIVAAAAAN